MLAFYQQYLQWSVRGGEVPNKVEFVSLVDLENMHTGSLMARRKALLKCEESFDMVSRDEECKAQENIIEFKDSEAWKSAYQDLKKVLSKRENWKSKGERKEERRLKAKK